MSYGWNYCSTCDSYRKHEECGDHMTLSCDHTAGEPNVPEWTYWFRTDDCFEEWVTGADCLVSVNVREITSLASLFLLKRMHEKMCRLPVSEHYAERVQ